MNTNQRRITLILGAVAGGLLAAAFLPMAVASADDWDFTPDTTTFDPTQVVVGYPPLVDVVTGTELWNVYDQTTGVTEVPDFISGQDIQTTLGSFTNNDLLFGPVGLTYIINDIPVPAGTQVDLANFGLGFENEWIDIPGTGTGAGVSDLLITPFGDLPILGSVFADLGA